MNNIIFITGASSDIGIELIKSIKEEALIIAHFNTNNNAILKLQQEISNQIVPVQADFCSDESLMKLLDTIEFEIGIPNKIIHLASVKFNNIRFKDMKWERMKEELNVSLGSIMQILNRFLPKLSLEKRGRVITILSSVTIGVPPKALTQYTTIKYALLGLMKSLASEYAEKGITINSLSPSMVDTKFLSLMNERVIELTANSHPLKRIAKTEEIIHVVLMLMSDEAAYINGVNIPITGGSNF